MELFKLFCSEGEEKINKLKVQHKYGKQNKTRQIKLFTSLAKES